MHNEVGTRTETFPTVVLATKKCKEKISPNASIPPQRAENCTVFFFQVVLKKAHSLVHRAYQTMKRSHLKSMFHWFCSEKLCKLTSGNVLLLAWVIGMEIMKLPDKKSVLRFRANLCLKVQYFWGRHGRKYAMSRYNFLRHLASTYRLYAAFSDAVSSIAKYFIFQLCDCFFQKHFRTNSRNNCFVLCSFLRTVLFIDWLRHKT